MAWLTYFFFEFIKLNSQNSSTNIENEVIQGLDLILSQLNEPKWPRTVATRFTDNAQVIVYSKIATRSDGTCAASIPRSADPEAIRIFEDQCLSIPGATIVVRDAAVTCLFESTPPA